jgi:Sec-independent protein translocase protein TatA
MFGVGGTEILVIGFVIILLIRPEDMPAMMRKLGSLYGQIQRAYYAIIDEIENFDSSRPK